MVTSNSTVMKAMKELVEGLCSRECAGRGAGTLGGIRARKLVVDALRGAGLDPFEQRIGSSQGANVLATTKGDVDRYVLVAAHYDHLGGDAKTGRFYPGADDNAAAVAILADVARAITEARPEGRGVIFAAFDAEEPPWFLTGQMGSAYFAKHAREAVGCDLDRIDMMVCMDLVGHALGPDFLPLPAYVRSSVFALGAERSAGTAAIVDEIARAEEGVVIRRADAEIIPPLSDYDAFWKRAVPFLFLTGGRSARYHTPQDTPEHVDYRKVHATARWLERFVRASCGRSEDRVEFRQDARDDASSLRSFADIVAPLATVSEQAKEGADRARELLSKCDAEGRLPGFLSEEPSRLIMALESALA